MVPCPSTKPKNPLPELASARYVPGGTNSASYQPNPCFLQTCVKGTCAGKEACTEATSSCVMLASYSGVHLPRLWQSAESGPMRMTMKPVPTQEMPSRKRPTSGMEMMRVSGLVPW